MPIRTKIDAACSGLSLSALAQKHGCGGNSAFAAKKPAAQPKLASCRLLNLDLRPQLHHSVVRQIQILCRCAGVVVHMGKQLFGKRIYCAYYAVSYYFYRKNIV